MRRRLALLALAPLLCLPSCQRRSEPAAEAPDSTAESARPLPAEGVLWLDYAAGTAQASAASKPMLIDFWTDWCHWCKVMDKDTYGDEEVRRLLARSFIAVKVDAESAQPQGGEGAPTGVDLARMFQVNSYPTTWFVDSTGEKIAPLAGFVTPDQFLVVLDYIASEAYKTQKFQDFQAARAQAKQS